jgi:hypothetical protein
VAVVCLLVGSMHCLYYGVMFPPLYADIGGGDGSHGHAFTSAPTIYDLVFRLIGQHPLTYPMSSKVVEVLEEIKHFGISIS